METETKLQELATKLIEKNVNPSWLDWYVLYTRQTTAIDWKADFDELVADSERTREELARELRNFFNRYKRQQELMDK